jgi:ribosome assembly protein 3
MPTAKPTAPRRRNRKRKRRQASSSSSSESLDSSSDESEVPKKTLVNKAPLIKQQVTESSLSPSSSPSSSSDSEKSDDDDDDVPVTHPESSSAIPHGSDLEPAKARDWHQSPSPSPPPADAPPFLPPEGSSNRAQDEQALRNRFRQFWMASLADAFADDLEQIRQVRVVSTASESPFSNSNPFSLSLTSGVKGA